MARDIAELAQEPSAAGRPGHAERASVRGRWHGAALLLGLVSAALAVVVRPEAAPSAAERHQAELARAMGLLRDDRLDEAGAIGHELLRDSEAAGPTRATAFFVLGAAHFRRAQTADRQERPGQYWRAARLLQQAEALGVPPQHRPELEYRLARSLLGCDEPAAAIAHLSKAAELLPERKHECLRLLADAYQRLAKPDYTRAADALGQVLQAPDDSPQRRREEQLRYGSLLARIGQPDQALSVLANIPDDAQEAPRAAFWRGMALAAKGEHERAAEQLARSAGDLRLPPAMRRQAAYRHAEQLARLDRLAQARDAFDRIRTQSPETEEGVAAAVQQAIVLWKLARPTEAIERLAAMVKAVESPARFRNRHTPIGEIRKLIERWWRHMQDQHNYAEALRLAKLLDTIDPSARGRLLEARTAEAWARALGAKAAKPDVPALAETRAESLKRFKQAADAWAALAEARQTTGEYADCLWSAGQAYMAAGRARSALDYLNRFAHSVRRDPRYPQALVDLGRCHQRLKEYEKAGAYYTRAIEEFPKNQATFAARFERARCCQQSGQVEKAEGLFRQIIETGELTPEAREWRLSLFELAKLRFAKRDYPEAVKLLTEGIERYPDSPEALGARYALAEAYRHWAAKPSPEKLRMLSQRARVQLEAQRQQHWDKALRLHRDLTDRLDRLDRQGLLSRREETELRNSLFAVGECLVELQRPKEAIEAYQNAANHYQGRIWGMIAHVHMATCHSLAGDADQAGRVLQKAQWILEQLPDSEFRNPVLPFDREQWRRWIRLGATVSQRDTNPTEGRPADELVSR